MLDQRKAAILGALVEDHIESGAPVSSRVVLERSGLACSSATIRNELVVLEREGDVSKPHTSAGRVGRDVHLLGVEPGIVLLVLVADGGRVHQVVIRLAVPATPSEVADAHETLIACLTGKEIADHLEAPDLGSLPAAARSLVTRALDAVTAAADAGRGVELGGVGRRGGP